MRPTPHRGRQARSHHRVPGSFPLRRSTLVIGIEGKGKAPPPWQPGRPLPWQRHSCGIAQAPPPPAGLQSRGEGWQWQTRRTGHDRRVQNGQRGSVTLETRSTGSSAGGRARPTADAETQWWLLLSLLASWPVPALSPLLRPRCAWPPGGRSAGSGETVGVDGKARNSDTQGGIR